MADKQKTPKLDKEQTQQIATAKRDITIPLFDGIFRNLDDTLMQRGGGKGLKIYDEIERDCHAYAVLQKRKMAVIARDWKIEPASEDPRDKAAADLVRSQLQRIGFDQICLKALDAVLKGFSVGEILWERRDSEIVVKNILFRDQRRFAFDEFGYPRMLTTDAPIKGEVLPPRKFVVHRFGDKYDGPYGLGLGSKLFWPVFFKRQGIAFWLVFAEKFGSPTAVGKYPSGMGKKDQDDLLESVQSIAQNSGIIIPDGAAVDFIEAARSGTINTYEQLCRFMDEQISECVLGETLSTNIGKVGSKAAADTHNDVREELTDADCDLLSDTLEEQLFRPIVEFNLPGAETPHLKRPSFDDLTEEERQEKIRKTAAERLDLLDQLGYTPKDPLRFAQETFGGEWNYHPPSRATTSITPAFAEGETGVEDVLTDQLEAIAGPDVDAMIDQIKALAERANSLEELRDGLLELYADLDVDTLGELMSQALEVAELTGMADVNDGS